MITRGPVFGEHRRTNGNRSKDSLPGGRVTTYTYDAHGRMTTVSRPGLAPTTAYYSIINRPDSVRDGVNAVATRYGYDNLFLTSVTDAKGQLYGFVYNAVGWLTQRTDPTTGAEQYQYSRDGELRRWKNRRGQTIEHAYDALHRRTSKSGVNTATDSWAYPSDTVVVATSPVAVDTVVANRHGQLMHTSTLVANQFYTRRYTYTPAGALDSVIPSGGGGIAFTTRKYVWKVRRGTLKEIRLGAASTTTLGNNADGLAESFTFPGGDAVAQAFTTTHGAYSISSAAAYGQTIRRDLEYDKGIRVFRYNYYPDATTLQRRMQFTYDSLGRLLQDSLFQREGDPCQADADNGSRCGLPEDWQLVTANSFSYDAVGNRTDRSGDYGLGNRIRAFSNCTYETDTDGNVTKRTCGGASVTTDFWWSAENRLDSLKHGAQTTRFSYDANGRLAKKVGPEGTRYFLWDGDNLFAELDANGAKLSELSYYGVDVLHAIVLGSTTYYAHYDGTGNLIALTDASHTVRQTYSYELAEWGGSGAALEPFSGLDRARWKGALYMVSDASLYYMRNRWYETGTGRFLSEDPIGLGGGINAYAFGWGDPINTADPFGLDVTCYVHDRGYTISIGGTVVVDSDDALIICFGGGPSLRNAWRAFTGGTGGVGGGPGGFGPGGLGTVGRPAPKPLVERLACSVLNLLPRGVTLSAGVSGDMVAGSGFIHGAGVFINREGAGPYYKVGGGVGMDMSLGGEFTLTLGKYGGLAADFAAGTAVAGGGVSVNTSSLALSFQPAPNLFPVNWRGGATQTFPGYALNCRQ